MDVLGIGERVKEVRGSMSFPDFAQSLDVHRSTIIRWEREESYPDAQLIKRICEIYHVDPTWFITGEAPQLIQWDLLEGVVKEVLETCDELGIASSAEKKAALIVEFYKLSLEYNEQGLSLKERVLALAKLLVS